jgi:hypothetical protein
MPETPPQPQHQIRCRVDRLYTSLYLLLTCTDEVFGRRRVANSLKVAALDQLSNGVSPLRRCPGPNWPPKHIKGLNPIPRIEALTCDVTVGLTGFELATP